MIAGITNWIEVVSTLNVAAESFGGLGKGGLITVIVISVIAVITLVWIFRETGRRE